MISDVFQQFKVILWDPVVFYIIKRSWDQLIMAAKETNAIVAADGDANGNIVGIFHCKISPRIRRT